MHTELPGGQVYAFEGGRFFPPEGKCVFTTDKTKEELLMGYLHSDPTANRAVGAVERELRAMQKEAERIRVLRRNNMLSAEEEARARRRCIGIYKPLLERALRG